MKQALYQDALYPKRSTGTRSTRIALMAESKAGGGRGAGSPVILFDASKRETHHPQSNFKKLFRRLRASFQVDTNKDEITEKALEGVSLLVFGGPREKFAKVWSKEAKTTEARERERGREGEKKR